MSDLHRPALRTTIGRVAVAGAATLASVFAVSPAAFAADDTTPAEPTDSTTSTEAPAEVAPGSPTPADETPNEGTPEIPAATSPETAGLPAAESDDALDAPADEAEAAEEIEPDFGFQKFRVGVQIADGSFVPEGTTTIGSTFRIAITDAGGDVTVTTCTTTEDNFDEDTGQSFCPGEGGIVNQLRGAAEAEVSDDDEYVAAQSMGLEPGDTATITQTAAAPGLTMSSDSVTIEPCEAEQGVPICFSPESSPTPFKSTKVVFNNTGPLPVAENDSASTTEGKTVSIDVLDNDDTDDPDIDVAVSSRPSNGTAKVTGGTLAIRYTPESGFSGTDTFRYSLSDSNGTDRATVTVTVKNGSVSDTNLSSSSANSSGPLPDTGGADATLLGYAGLLLAGGGWLTLRGRRGTADASID